jgi:DNA-binding beta-propeller fold protein YncE
VDDTTKRLLLSGGQPIEYPGWWKIDGRVEGESRSWSVVRKPDGTWWYVAVNHIFPPGGGLLRIELGDQITDAKVIVQCEEYFAQMQQKMEGDQKLKEGDRVRVIKTGTAGVIKGFGSLPGVPKTINVAYDGGGGCNHIPAELEKVKGI